MECAVVGEPHPDSGQQVAAVVVLAEGATASEADLREFARDRLAYFKVPERWRITSESLPRNITGKLIRSGITV